MTAAARLARVGTGAAPTLVVRLRAMSQHVGAAAESLATLANSGTNLCGWSGGGYDTFVRAVAAARARLLRMGDALEVAASALSLLTAALHAVQDEAKAANRVLCVAGPTDPGPAIASELARVMAAFQDADSRAAMLRGEVLLLDLSHPPRCPAASSR